MFYGKLYIFPGIRSNRRFPHVQGQLLKPAASILWPPGRPQIDYFPPDGTKHRLNGASECTGFPQDRRN